MTQRGLFTPGFRASGPFFNVLVVGIEGTKEGRSMKILVFGATGMIGRGALREALMDPGVELVQTVGRAATGWQDAKLREVVHADLWDYSAVEGQLQGFDACFFCLGTPSGGKSEAEYSRITYDLTLAAAQTLARLNPNMVFIYVSGEGADSTEQGNVMWARVRGRTENALLRLPFRTYIFRPGLTESRHGFESKVTAYRLLYKFMKPVLPLVRALLPRHIATTEEIGRAMLAVARQGGQEKILRVRDFPRLAGGEA
jgi:uncharacterized protein YbjT (DUF2867 family)